MAFQFATMNVGSAGAGVCNVIPDIGNDDPSVCNIAMDIGDIGVLVLSVLMSVRAGYTCVHPKFSLEPGG